MNFVEHGFYKIEVDENIFIMTYWGSWNAEAAESCFDDFKKLVETSKYTHFGVISDIREWEGSTPSALEIAAKGFEYFNKNGQIASAQVNNSLIKQKLAVKAWNIKDKQIPRDSFTTKEEALSWMKKILKGYTS